MPRLPLHHMAAGAEPGPKSRRLGKLAQARAVPIVAAKGTAAAVAQPSRVTSRCASELPSWPPVFSATAQKSAPLTRAHAMPWYEGPPTVHAERPAGAAGSVTDSQVQLV